MSQVRPAEIGMALDAVDTPALLIDLDAFDRNVARLTQAIAGTSVRARPHATRGRQNGHAALVDLDHLSI